jgi:hypothetical protein
MVWSLKILVWFGLVWFSLSCFGFSTGAGGFIFLVFFQFDAATLGLDWTFLVHIPACVRLLLFSGLDEKLRYLILLYVLCLWIYLPGTRNLMLTTDIVLRCRDAVN